MENPHTITAPRDDLFRRCRAIPAQEAARLLGIPLSQKGTRHWTRCPFHEDGTPSMMFDDRGRFYCFSCREHGDAVALVSKAKQIKPILAARFLLGEMDESQFKPLPVRVDHPLKTEVKHWFKKEYDLASLTSREMSKLIEDISACPREMAGEFEGDDPWDKRDFCEAVQEKAWADIMLERLQTQDPFSLLALYLERKENTQEEKQCL